MSYTSIVSSCFVFILLCFEVHYVQAQTPPEPKGRRLREIIEDKYQDRNILIGGTTGEWAFSRPTGKIMDREFSYVTPENDFKQWQIHPDNSGTWNWIEADRWRTHVVSNNQVLRMHGPVGPQCSSWAQADTRTPEELETNMRAYVQRLCERYNGITNFDFLDVVNETVIGGKWHENKAGTGWEMPWFIIGQDNDKNKTPLYIKYAFEIANEYAPDIKLVINQHEGTINTSSWNLIKETVQYLRDLGLRVDGIGWQGHINAGWEKINGQQEALRNLIDWAHQNNLDFHVTENDVGIPNNSEANLKAQAETYKALLDIIVEKSENGLVTYNTWAIDDRNSWRGDEYAALFDEYYRAKPAYYAIQLALEAKGDYTTNRNVAFQIKNTESGNPIENSLVTFNNESKYTNEKGEVNFQVVAGFYDVHAEKRHYKSASIGNISVYSDTLLNLMLDSAEVKYNVSFLVKDKSSGEKLSAVNVEVDEEQLTTGVDGKADFVLNPGVYSPAFSKTNYADQIVEYMINSDTTLNVFLERSHANVKFRVKDGSQPINNALVVFGNDSLYTGALGICTFKSVPLQNSFHYTIERQYFKSLEGMISVHSDTTLNIQMEKTVANIEFQITSERVPIQNAFVIINNDTAWFNSSNSASFFNLPYKTEYSYLIRSDNYSDYSDNLLLETDTTIFVDLINSVPGDLKEHLIFKIYPNPVDYRMAVLYPGMTGVKISNINGQEIRTINFSSANQKVIEVGDLNSGTYFVTALTPKGNYTMPFIKK